MKMRSRLALAAAALAGAGMAMTGGGATAATAETPASSAAAERPIRTAASDYESLVGLFREWRELQAPELVDAGPDAAPVPDYTPEAIERQLQGLSELRERLAAIDPGDWPVSQRIDYHLVRAEMNGLDFEHRVLRPWARDPAFYAVLHEGPTDVPEREGPHVPGAIELWTYDFPLALAERHKLEAELRAVPRLLEQARDNLTVEARDLWYAGIWMKERESDALAGLARRIGNHHADDPDAPGLLAAVEEARGAVDAFRDWLEERHASMTASSAIGVEEFDWYMRNVQLNPYGWHEQMAMMERELARSLAHLKLLENANRELPELELIDSAEEWSRRFDEAVSGYMEFLRDEEIWTVADWMEPALRARKGSFRPPGETGYDFFVAINYRDPLVMRTHDTHWIDLARMRENPHPSPIRREPLLYNIFVNRAEGLATGMEEMMMSAGLFDGRPRTQELIHILVAGRAARAIAGLKQHAGEFTLQQAVDFFVDNTPRGWVLPDGNTAWFDEILYLRQPGYGTSYLVGKAQIERLLADRARQLGDDFTLKRFMDELFAAGMIPPALIRWEMTGQRDEIEELLPPPGSLAR